MASAKSSRPETGGFRCLSAKTLTKEKQKFTVAQALDGYISLKSNVLSPSTIHGYGILRRNRLQSLMSLDIHEVNSFTMQQAINEDAATVSGKTINEAKNLVLTALKLYGVKPDICVTLPAKQPVIKNLPTAEEFINIIRGTDIELPCLLAVWLSLRISEVRGLQFGDIKDNRITVRRSKLYFDGADHVRNVNKTFSAAETVSVHTTAPEFTRVHTNYVYTFFERKVHTFVHTPLSKMS